MSFPFLLDEERSVTKAYGLYHRLAIDALNIAHPATLVIDRDRKIAYIYRGDSQTDRATVRSRSGGGQEIISFWRNGSGMNPVTNDDIDQEKRSFTTNSGGGMKKTKCDCFACCYSRSRLGHKPIWHCLQARRSKSNWKKHSPHSPAKKAMPFPEESREAVVLDGKTVIPVGATVQGRVTKVNEPRRIAGKPTIGIFPEAVVLPNGERYMLNATMVDTNLRNGTDVNTEGQFKGDGLDGKDLTEIGMGTGGGMLIGGLAGGGKGLLIGGAVGATLTVAHWLGKKRVCGTAFGHRVDDGIEPSNGDDGRDRRTIERRASDHRTAFSICRPMYEVLCPPFPEVRRLKPVLPMSKHIFLPQ